MRTAGALLCAAALAGAVAALPSSCYTTADDTPAGDTALMLCGYCSTADLNFWAPPADVATLCAPGATPDRATVVDTLVAAILNATQLQGYFFVDGPGNLEENATEALTYLVAGMPRRDLIQMFAAPLEWSDFLIEHVRYALYAYHTFSRNLGVVWSDFLDAVLPYATLNEKRDTSFRWRPRFFQALMPLVAAANVTTTLGAYRVVVAAISSAQLLGTLGVNSTLVPGSPITWHSESSPARLSVQDTVQFGASCTGTGITQVAAARSVGLPVRLEGCSESVVRGDDHHWTALRDWTDPGPFGTYWHTREGSSAGNPDGPWDAPSGPMLGCLQGVVPGSTIDTLWATSWGASVHFPTLWSNDARSAVWAKIGGVNVCGDYCTAWGCGTNNTQRWSQSQCGPTSA